MFNDSQEGQTHFENDGCGEPGHNKETVKISCLSLDCPERKSLCCGAWSISGGPYEPRFICANCRKEFVGGECNAMGDRSKIGEILADFEQDHDEEKAGLAIYEEIEYAIEDTWVEATKHFEAVCKDMVEEQKEKDASILDILADNNAVDGFLFRSAAKAIREQKV